METFDLDLIRQAVKRITMYDDGNIQFEWNVDDFYRLMIYFIQESFQELSFFDSS